MLCSSLAFGIRQSLWPRNASAFLLWTQESALCQSIGAPLSSMLHIKPVA